MNQEQKNDPIPLIQTKLHRPQPNATLIHRPHLLARLDDGLNQKLTLISAPAGFGKTTLASQWLAGCDRLGTWLSLDESDNTLPQFLRYVCAAVRYAIPEACATLQALLNTANLPDLEYLADLLLEELNALPAELILVLDDYHRIQVSEIHHLLRHLLRYRPPRLHLVILTRTDPPLYLGRLRMGQQITEIRAADLRFALPETRRLLRVQTGQPLDDEFIQSLHTRSEGWIIGLQLAGISLQSQSPHQFLARFGGSHRLLTGYLVEEVMSGLPETVTMFLTRTALPDRFCAPLGDVLLADSLWPDTSQATMAQLEAQNLFIIPLDDEGTWFRYHDLFRDFLLNRLKKEQGQEGLAQLHHRAGVWLAQAGLIEDALRHLLAAGDETGAASLVETNLQLLLQNQQVSAPMLANWLNLFSEEAIQTHPGLCIAQLYLFAIRWDLTAMAASINQTVSLVQTDSSDAEQRQQRLAVLDVLRGHLLYWQGRAPLAIPLLQHGLDKLDPAAYSFTIAHATFTLALSYAYCGQQKTALSLLQAALDKAIAHHRPAMFIFLGIRVFIQMSGGHLAEAAVIAQNALAMAKSPAWSDTGLVQTWRGWTYYFLGIICYEQNDLEAAAQNWRQVEALRYQVNPGAFHDSLAGRALIAQIQSQTVQALAYAQTAQAFAMEMRSPPLLMLSQTLAVKLALLGGNPTEALRYAGEINPSSNQSNALWLEPPSLTVLRVRLAAGTPESLATALELAETCLRQAEKAHNARQIIQVTALQALIRHRLRQPAKAMAALDQALILGEPGSFTRTFLDLGPAMAELLERFDQRRGSNPYVKRLLAAFARELAPAGRHDQIAHYVQLHGITPLTQRELEVLALVDQRLTVKEMAEQLVISPHTVKNHLSNIYSKLGVNNRRQAAAKARDVGLLPPS